MLWKPVWLKFPQGKLTIPRRTLHNCDTENHIVRRLLRTTPVASHVVLVQTLCYYESSRRTNFKTIAQNVIEAPHRDCWRPHLTAAHASSCNFCLHINTYRAAMWVIVPQIRLQVFLYACKLRFRIAIRRFQMLSNSQQGKSTGKPTTRFIRH